VQSFPVGGKFTTTGPQAIVVGDNASGQEEVTVSPKGSGGSSEKIIVVIDGEQFKGYMQRQIDNRGLRSSRGGAI